MSHFLKPNFILLLCTLTGCGLFGGAGEVTGVVNVDGAPAPGFQITFTSTKDPSLFIRGIVGEEGRFRLSRGRGKLQVPTGEYRITLTPVAVGETISPSKLKLPERYFHVEQTDLREVVRSGKNELNIELKTE